MICPAPPRASPTPSRHSNFSETVPWPLLASPPYPSASLDLPASRSSRRPRRCVAASVCISQASPGRASRGLLVQWSSRLWRIVIASSYDCARYPHNGVEITSYNRDIFATPRERPRYRPRDQSLPRPWGLGVAAGVRRAAIAGAVIADKGPPPIKRASTVRRAKQAAVKHRPTQRAQMSPVR